MAKKITGVAIAPGISKNGKRYTRDNIAKAYGRMKTRIADGTHPIVMRTHHGAGDDSSQIVARLTGVSLSPSDGALIYEAVTQDTAAGRDIEAMIPEDAADKTKALAHVSIWGAWVGKARKKLEGGRWIEEADDFEIDKLDFTASPGVFGTTATVESWMPSDDPGVLMESDRLVMFSDSVDLTESDVDRPSLVSVSISGCVEGFDLSICAWGVPASEVDAWADTAQRAFAAASTICAGGPVDDDADAAGEAKPDDNAMESHKLSVDLTESIETKEPTMADEAKTEKVEEISESVEAPLTAAGIAEALVAALKTAGVITESASEVESPVVESSETSAAAGETTPDASTLSESDLAKIRADVLASIIANGDVKPTRKGFGLAETTSASEDDALSWDNRGDAMAKAFGISAGIDVEATEDAGAA